MKKYLVAFFLLSGLASFFTFPASADSLSPELQSKAYERYLQRSPSELSKLIYLLERYKDTDIKVIYDGNEYDALEGANYAKRYLAQHYNKKENAEKWLKIHAYRSTPAGNVIYFKFSDGQRRPMLDVLLEELRLIEKARSVIK